MAERGRIKKILWDHERGGYFGFIERPTGDDVWFSGSVVRGLSLVPNDQVEFILAKNTARLRAAQVWRV